MAIDRERQWIRRLLTALLLMALVLPAVRNEDGLPFSTYPMYAGVRSNEISFVVAVGVDEQGREVPLSMPIIADTRDPLIAQSFLNDAVARGDAEAVCEEIAGRVSELATIEIATERHDAVERLSGNESLLDRRLHTTCSVAG